MKFSVKISNLGRSGRISDLANPWSSEVFKTPGFVTYTRAGTIPHLTFNTMQRLDDQKMLLQQTMPSVVEFKEAIKVQGKGLNSFVGCPEYPFYVSMQDPFALTPTGYNVNKGVSVWCDGGKKLLSSTEFMEAIKTFRPACYQALTDSDTPQDCSKKRLNKSVDNSLRFLDDCLEEHKSCEELKETAILATIQGGYDLFLRKKSALETSKRSVDGYVIDGFHINGPDVENVDFPKVKEIFLEIFSILPENKLRVLHGAFEPEIILEAVKCGIDLFDSSYVSKLTELGEASVFPLNTIPDYFKNEMTDNPSKRFNYTSKLCLKEELFKDDLGPILDGCECYTCKHYTRAYIHHLLVTSELLAQILLTMHNLNHLSNFFKTIRNTLENKE